MKTEAKAKVVASVWGADLVKFLVALAVLPRSIWKNKMNSTASLHLPLKVVIHFNIKTLLTKMDCYSNLRSQTHFSLFFFSSSNLNCRIFCLRNKVDALKQAMYERSQDTIHPNKLGAGRDHVAFALGSYYNYLK